MPKPRSIVDDALSQLFDTPLNRELAFTLSRRELFSITQLDLEVSQTITIPSVAGLPREQWPIGGIGYFFNTNNVTMTVTPSAGVTINGGTSAITFNTNGFNAPVLLVRDQEDAWNLHQGGSGGSIGGNNGALVTPTVATSTPNVVATIIPMGAETYDNGDWFDFGTPTRLTVPAGVDFVQVSARCTISGVVGASNQLYSILKNGTPIYTGNASEFFNIPFFASIAGSIHTAIIPVVAGDFFELQVIPVGGGAGMTVNIGGTWFSINAF